MRTRSQASKREEVKREWQLSKGKGKRPRKESTGALYDSDQGGGVGGYSSSSSTVEEVDLESVVIASKRVITQSRHKSVRVSVSRGRPETSLGTDQGDHVSAYRVVLETLVTALEGKRTRDGLDALKNLAIDVMPHKQHYFEEKYNEAIQQIEQHSIPKGVIEEAAHILQGSVDASAELKQAAPKIGQLLREVGSNARHKAIDEMVEEFLRRINQEDAITFRREGAFDKTHRAQGTKVTQAAYALKVVDDADKLIDAINEGAEAVANRLEKFSVSLHTKAYKTGFNYLVGGRTVGNGLCRRWETAETLEKKRGILEEIKGGVTPQRVAELFGDLFDFPYNKHSGVDRVNLARLVARHLVIMFLAFDKTRQYNIDQIVDTFLVEEVGRKAGWSERLDWNPYLLKIEISKYATLSCDRVCVNQVSTGADQEHVEVRGKRRRPEKEEAKEENKSEEPVQRRKLRGEQRLDFEDAEAIGPPESTSSAGMIARNMHGKGRS